MALDRRVRIEDYLNDRLQSQADLDNLDALLQTVKEQQTLLKNQLQRAQSDHDDARKQTTAQQQDLLARAETFRRTQADIDQRLLALTGSEVSEDAIRKFEVTMRKLGEVEIAENYIGLLAEVERLSKETASRFEESPRSALGPYAELQVTIGRLHAAMPGTDEAALHLSDHVEKVSTKLWAEMRAVFSKDLEAALRKMNWPRKDARMDAVLEADWIASVDLLLDLQKTRLDVQGEQPKSEVLLPLEVMMKPLAARFRYHFDGDRPTNRLDKPEYFLSHAMELCSDYDAFFALHLQPILQRHFVGTALALNPLYIDSTSALITAVLPVVREKLRGSMLDISKRPQLLSHLMHELMTFDATLRDDWSYGGGSPEGWKGLAGELLDDGWFARWLGVEKDFALERYQNIIDTPDSGEIDFDSVSPGDTKPTKAAIRVNDLLETITERYRPLTSFKQKLKFVVDIQLAVFDRYHDRLNEALEAFITLSNPIARKVQGFSREDALATQGNRGLDRLCRVYGSAEYLARKMTDWSNDIFFLELWDELQYRSREHDDAQQTLGISVGAVSSKSSDDGALFDEISTHYEKLRSRTEEVLCEQTWAEVRDALRPYNRAGAWSTSDLEPAVSSELDAALQLMSEKLVFLSSCLAIASLRRIGRSLLHDMQDWLWDHIVLRNNFSTAGVEQLRRDLDAVILLFDRACGQGFGRAGLEKLEEATSLMALPVDGDGDGESLRDVEARIFKSNDDARAVLDELNIEVLTETEGRSLVQKRIELGA